MLTLEGIAVDVHGRTDVGKVRTVNEDQFLIAALHKVIEIHGTSIPDRYRTQIHSGARAILLLVADGGAGTPAADSLEPQPVTCLGCPGRTPAPLPLR